MQFSNFIFLFFSFPVNGTWRDDFSETAKFLIKGKYIKLELTDRNWFINMLERVERNMKLFVEFKKCWTIEDGLMILII